MKLSARFRVPTKAQLQGVPETIMPRSGLPEGLILAWVDPARNPMGNFMPIAYR